MRTMCGAAILAVGILFACNEQRLSNATVEEVTTVTEVGAGDCLRGWFLPDGATVAFTGAKYRGLSHYSLGDRTVKVISTAEGTGFIPAWPAPAGGPTAVMGERGVRIVPAPGATPVALADGSHSPRLSPDGKRVAYILGNDVRVYDLVTGADRALIAGSQPAWMPDGTALVVAVTRDDGRDVTASKLYLVALDGTKRPVRTVPGAIPLYPDVAGQRLLYTDHASGRILVHSLETE